MTHPSYRLHLGEARWAIENKGVEPHHIVESPPHVSSLMPRTGGGGVEALAADPQLEVAAEVALKLAREALEARAKAGLAACHTKEADENQRVALHGRRRHWSLAAT